MNGPDPPAERCFFSYAYAAEHLCDHVLTRPEAHDWAAVLPRYRGLVSPTDDAVLRRLAASLFLGPPCPEAWALLDLYVAAILQNIEDALRLGFWWEQRQGKYQEWFGLGLDGVHVIWDREVIKTGFIRGSASRQPGGEIPRTENPLPRRDPAKQLRPPPPDFPRRRYQLFDNGHHCFARDYDEASKENKVLQEGGGPFVDCDHAPRIGKWQRWLSERPARTS